jgi:hypothetical protein
MSIFFPDSVTKKDSKAALERMESVVQTTHLKRIEKIKTLQIEVQILLDHLADLLEDEAAYQDRMDILPSIAEGTGGLEGGKRVENPLSTLPDFTRDNRGTSILNTKAEDPFFDLEGSPNIVVKDPQVVQAYLQMMSVLDSVYKNLKLHEHKIKNAKLQAQIKMQKIEALQAEILRRDSDA